MTQTGQSELHMASYGHLTQAQRYQIAGYLEAGLGYAQIGRKLGVDRSTVWREVQRNGGAHYTAQRAQKRNQARRAQANDRSHWGLGVWARVLRKLKRGWSPGLIAGWLAAERGIAVSAEGIYQRIYKDQRNGGELHRHLVRQQPQRKRRYRDTRGQMPDRVDIEQRPAIVAERRRVGDWEGDTVVGPSPVAVLTLLERVARRVEIRRLERKTAQATGSAIIQALAAHRDKRHTLTLDNGSEFAHHARVTQALGMPVYFARPYAAWQRGANENINGLLRRTLKKGSNLARYSVQDLRKLQNQLNNKPRKCLGYKTPNQVFFNCNRSTKKHPPSKQRRVALRT